MTKTNKQNKSMTIDQAIKQLTKIRKSSRLGGNTVLVVCLDASGYEYMDVSALNLREHFGEALCLVRVAADDHGFIPC